MSLRSDLYASSQDAVQYHIFFDEITAESNITLDARNETVLLCTRPRPSSVSLPSDPDALLGERVPMYTFLQAFRAACLDLIHPITGAYLWNNEPFNLHIWNPITASNTTDSFASNSSSSTSSSSTSQNKKKDTMAEFDLNYTSPPLSEVDLSEFISHSTKDFSASFSTSTSSPSLPLRTTGPLPFSDVPHLYGRTDVGSSLSDQWMILYLLLQLTSRFPNLTIRITDTQSGHFLLTECAYLLPSWLGDPITAQLRVWLRRGHVLVIPRHTKSSRVNLKSKKEGNISDNAHAIPHPLTPDSALQFVRGPSGGKCLPPHALHRSFLRRIENFPQESLLANSHVLRLLLPQSAGKILAEMPWIIPHLLTMLREKDIYGKKSDATLARFLSLPSTTFSGNGNVSHGMNDSSSSSSSSPESPFEWVALRVSDVVFAQMQGLTRSIFPPKKFLTALPRSLPAHLLTNITTSQAAKQSAMKAADPAFGSSSQPLSDVFRVSPEASSAVYKKLPLDNTKPTVGFEATSFTKNNKKDRDFFVFGDFIAPSVTTADEQKVALQLGAALTYALELLYQFGARQEESVRRNNYLRAGLSFSAPSTKEEVSIQEDASSTINLPLASNFVSSYAYCHEMIGSGPGTYTQLQSLVNAINTESALAKTRVHGDLDYLSALNTPLMPFAASPMTKVTDFSSYSNVNTLVSSYVPSSYLLQLPIATIASREEKDSFLDEKLEKTEKAEKAEKAKKAKKNLHVGVNPLTTLFPSHTFYPVDLAAKQLLPSFSSQHLAMQSYIHFFVRQSRAKAELQTEKEIEPESFIPNPLIGSPLDASYTLEACINEILSNSTSDIDRGSLSVSAACTQAQAEHLRTIIEYHRELHITRGSITANSGLFNPIVFRHFVDFILQTPISDDTTTGLSVPFPTSPREWLAAWHNLPLPTRPWANVPLILSNNVDLDLSYSSDDSPQAQQISYQKYSREDAVYHALLRLSGEEDESKVATAFRLSEVLFGSKRHLIRWAYPFDGDQSVSSRPLSLYEQLTQVTAQSLSNPRTLSGRGMLGRSASISTSASNSFMQSYLDRVTMCSLRGLIHVPPQSCSATEAFMKDDEIVALTASISEAKITVMRDKTEKEKNSKTSLSSALRMTESTRVKDSTLELTPKNEKDVKSVKSVKIARKVENIFAQGLGMGDDVVRLDPQGRIIPRDADSFEEVELLSESDLETDDENDDVTHTTTIGQRLIQDDNDMQDLYTKLQQFMSAESGLEGMSMSLGGPDKPGKLTSRVSQKRLFETKKKKTKSSHIKDAKSGQNAVHQHSIDLEKLDECLTDLQGLSGTKSDEIVEVDTSTVLSKRARSRPESQSPSQALFSFFQDDQSIDANQHRSEGTRRRKTVGFTPTDFPANTTSMDNLNMDAGIDVDKEMDMNPTDSEDDTNSSGYDEEEEDDEDHNQDHSQEQSENNDDEEHMVCYPVNPHSLRVDFDNYSGSGVTNTEDERDDHDQHQHQEDMFDKSLLVDPLDCCILPGKRNSRFAKLEKHLQQQITSVEDQRDESYQDEFDSISDDDDDHELEQEQEHAFDMYTADLKPIADLHFEQTQKDRRRYREIDEIDENEEVTRKKEISRLNSKKTVRFDGVVDEVDTNENPLGSLRDRIRSRLAYSGPSSYDNMNDIIDMEKEIDPLLLDHVRHSDSFSGKTVMSNLLKSYHAQAGGIGPVSGLLASLGFAFPEDMPDDEDNDEAGEFGGIRSDENERENESENEYSHDGGDNLHDID